MNEPRLTTQTHNRYYNSNTKRCGWKSKDDLVRFANRFATDVCGFCVPPALMKKTVGKMGLRGQRGLRVQGRGGVPMQETLIPGERFSSSDRMDIAEEAPVVDVRPPIVPPVAKDTKKRKVCRFFSTEQGCRFGLECRFLHETAVEDSKNRTKDNKNNNNKNRRRRRRRKGGSGSMKQEN